MTRNERRVLQYFHYHLDRLAVRRFNRCLGFPENHPIWGPMSTFRKLGMIRSEKRPKKNAKIPA